MFHKTYGEMRSIILQISAEVDRRNTGDPFGDCFDRKAYISLSRQLASALLMLSQLKHEKPTT